jgi:hypothetical protein
MIENEEVITEEEESPNIEIEEEEQIQEEPTQDFSQEQQAIEFYGNLAEQIDERVLGRMASDLVSDYKKDKESRADWEKSYIKGLDLLGFKYSEESRPFVGASSVTHPLLAEAVTQFQAQAYKELLPSNGPVKTQVIGERNPEREQQAQRVKEFMNYMLTDKMEEYTPEFDQMLFYLPLAGSTFKKVYFDEVIKRAVSKFIPAEDLVVPYYATDLKDCDRITHIIKMSENDILKKQRAGFYREVDILPSRSDDSDVQDKYNQIEGTSDTDDRDYQFNILEMHIDLDLEEYEVDEDLKNIKVPYIVTIDEGSQEILSIYRNYKPTDETFKRKDFFVHFKFLPGLGFYGFGLIHMIGGLSRAATSALRQLLDAGTLANLPAGFKSRGIRVRDDDQPFQPGEFRDVDAPGGNIKDQFMLLPFKDPSQTLFSLLGFVVQAGQRFASIADMQTGNDKQNRAVGSTLALLERGSRVMSAIHKRCYYSMRQEFKLLGNVFGTYLPPVYPYAVYGGNRFVKMADFSSEVDVLPVADPDVFSLSQRFTLAQTQLQVASAAPQLHDMREAYYRVYEALGTKQIDSLLKPAQKPVPLDPAIENSNAMKMVPLKAFMQQDHDAHIQSHTAFMNTRMVQINPQVYSSLQAHIMEHISFKARAIVLLEIQNDQNLVQMSKADPENFEALTDSMIAKQIAELTQSLTNLEAGSSKPDPLVALKQRELDLKALDLQRKAQEFSDVETRKNEEFDEKIDLEKMKREDAEFSSSERIRVADQKIDIMRDKNEKENKQ